MPLKPPATEAASEGSREPKTTALPAREKIVARPLAILPVPMIASVMSLLLSALPHAAMTGICICSVLIIIRQNRRRFLPNRKVYQP